MEYLQYIVIIYGSILIYNEIRNSQNNSCLLEKSELENKFEQIILERNNIFIGLSKLLQHYEE
jgi:hypothetical protein